MTLFLLQNVTIDRLYDAAAYDRAVLNNEKREVKMLLWRLWFSVG